jgi:hypothetical protein
MGILSRIADNLFGEVWYPEDEGEETLAISVPSYAFPEPGRIHILQHAQEPPCAVIMNIADYYRLIETGAISAQDVP